MRNLRDVYARVAGQAAAALLARGTDEQETVNAACRIADEIRRRGPTEEEADEQAEEDRDEDESEDDFSGLLIAQGWPPDHLNSLESVAWILSFADQEEMEAKGDWGERRVELIREREQLTILHLLRSQGMSCPHWRFGHTTHNLDETDPHIGRCHCLLHAGHAGPHEFASVASQTSRGYPDWDHYNNTPPDPSGDEYAPEGFVFTPPPRTAEDDHAR